MGLELGSWPVLDQYVSVPGICPKYWVREALFFSAGVDEKDSLESLGRIKFLPELSLQNNK